MTLLLLSRVLPLLLVSVLVVEVIGGGVGAQDELVDCAPDSPLIVASECAARGCVWTKGVTSHNCSYAYRGVPPRVVHMINSNHFDAGYANFTANVVNEYFETYFPRAAAVGKELRAMNAGPLRWMTFSYLLTLYFDCPPGMGLKCPSEDERNEIAAAIQAEDIVFPAFPHNAELATLDEKMMTFGVALSRSIAAQFNVTAPSVLSTRDVPGMPRAALPILRRAGVKGLSEGMNGRMIPVNVPPTFLWSSADGSVEMPVFWHSHGYGSIGDLGNPVRVPGTGHVLCYAWRGDNQGPPVSAQEVLDNVKKVKAMFDTNVTIVSSTLDMYLDAIEKDGALSKLPVITSDLSDSWIWGVASDPVKQSRMRAMSRMLASTEVEKNDAFVFNFSRLALKNSEHTWGLSVFHYGGLGDQHWSNADFHNDLKNHEPHLEAFIESWQEQRDWGINYALDALPSGHPLKRAIEQEFENITPKAPPTTDGFVRVVRGKTGYKVACKTMNVTIGDDGSISRFDSQFLNSTWTNLGQLTYQTLDIDDFTAWQKEYLLPGSGGLNEYGKPKSFMDATPTPTHTLSGLIANGVFWSESSSQILVTGAFPSSMNAYYGAPSAVWIKYELSNDTSFVQVKSEVYLLNKTATRLPEAMFYSFSPSVENNAQWEQNILNEWSLPNDVADGAARGMHYVTDKGVRISRSDGAVQFQSYDSGLLRWGPPLPFPTPINGSVAVGSPASFCLHNQMWNTNYPLWFPFDAAGARVLQFRFSFVFY